MSPRIIFATALITLSIFVSGCRNGLFGSEDVPVVQPETPAPATPMVVDGMRTSYADIVERSSPAVVQIAVEVRSSSRASRPEFDSPLDEFFRQFPTPRGNEQPRVQRGFGSGVIVSADGSIITNAHVVDGAEKITVMSSDNKEFTAKLVGIDKPSDLAVLKIEAQNLPFLSLGNSDTVRVGDIVLAIGNPLGIGQSVTAGIISAKGRQTGLSYGGNYSFEDFLQTDAPINRGNSGGALINLQGELIGINSQILSSGGSGGNIGIAFSIPSNMAKNILEQILNTGRVRRGFLGIQMQNLTGDLAESLDMPEASGVIVNNVSPGRAAEKAGIKRGDVITAVNGEKIVDGNTLRNKIAGTVPGTEVKLTVSRGGESQEIAVTLDEYDLEGSTTSDREDEGKEPQKEPSSGRLGVSVVPLTPQMAKQYGSGTETQGVVVMEVNSDSVAAEAGILKGDILMEVNRKPVSSGDEVETVLQGAAGKPVLLLISRKGNTLYLTARMK